MDQNGAHCRAAVTVAAAGLAYRSVRGHDDGAGRADTCGDPGAARWYGEDAVALRPSCRAGPHEATRTDNGARAALLGLQTSRSVPPRG